MNLRAQVSKRPTGPGARLREEMNGLINDDPGLDMAADDEDMIDDPDEPQKKKILGRFSSVEELIEAFLKLEARLETMAERTPKAKPKAQARDRRPVASPVQASEFWDDLSRAYVQDPLLTTHMMISQANEDLLEEIESRFSEVLGDQRAKEELKELLSRPENNPLRAHKKHLEYLVLDQGMDPADAAEFLMELLGEQSPVKRAQAAKSVRNQSTMEVGRGAPKMGVGADGDFDKVLKKSKTLNEMFDGLRKIPL